MPYTMTQVTNANLLLEFFKYLQAQNYKYSLNSEQYMANIVGSNIAPRFEIKTKTHICSCGNQRCRQSYTRRTAEANLKDFTDLDMRELMIGRGGLNFVDVKQKLAEWAKQSPKRASEVAKDEFLRSMLPYAEAQPRRTFGKWDITLGLFIMGYPGIVLFLTCGPLAGWLGALGGAAVCGFVAIIGKCLPPFISVVAMADEYDANAANTKEILGGLRKVEPKVVAEQGYESVYPDLNRVPVVPPGGIAVPAELDNDGVEPGAVGGYGYR